MPTRFDPPLRPHTAAPAPADEPRPAPVSAAAGREAAARNGGTLEPERTARKGVTMEPEKGVRNGRTMVHENGRSHTCGGGSAEGRHLAVVRTPGRERHGGVRALEGRAVVGVPREGGAAWLADGERVWLREAGPQDRDAALALHGRCSERTLRLRYRGPAADADGYLGHLLDPRHGHCLAVADRGGEFVALGHLLWDGEESEIALLVADEWQRRGVGTLLLRRLVALARARRRTAVYAVTSAADTATWEALRGLGVPLEWHEEHGVVVLGAGMGGVPANSGNAEEERGARGRK